MRARTRSTALALTACLALAGWAASGCAGDTGPGTADPSPAGSPASTPPGSAEAVTEPAGGPPDLPAEAEGTTEAAAEAFVRHFFATTNYAMATGDTAQLHSLAHPRCRSCDGGAGWIDSVYEAGGILDGGLYEIVEAVTSQQPGSPQHETLVELRLDAGRRVVTGTGSELDSEFDGGMTEMDVTVAHHDGAWTVVQWAMG